MRSYLNLILLIYERTGCKFDYFPWGFSESNAFPALFLSEGPSCGRQRSPYFQGHACITVLVGNNTCVNYLRKTIALLCRKFIELSLSIFIREIFALNLLLFSRRAIASAEEEAGMWCYQLSALLDLQAGTKPFLAPKQALGSWVVKGHERVPRRQMHRQPGGSWENTVGERRDVRQQICRKPVFIISATCLTTCALLLTFYYGKSD